ncbi:uncharacterized protein LOC111115329 [Crassostrea virginica]
MQLILVILSSVILSSLVHGRSYNQQTPDYLKCPYGKYFKDIGQQPTCNPFGQSCPPGYYCGAGPADQPGFCCKTDNPCKLGEPYSRNGDAPHCLGKGAVRCPRGYTCIGTTTSSSVCCQGCSYKGESYFPTATFYKDGKKCTCGNDGRVRCKVVTCRANGKEYKVGESFQVDCNGCTCQPDGNAVCTLIACPVYCHYGGKKYAEGETFPAKDGCNTCSCKSDRSVECSRNPCYPKGYAGK